MTPEILADKETGLGWHPKRVLLILLIFSIVMMFAAFTSGYIVRRDEGNWRRTKALRKQDGRGLRWQLREV